MERSTAPRGGNVRNSRCTHPNKRRRQESAKEQVKNRRSPKEQILWLSRQGYRAIKERERLVKQIQNGI